jgi:hypothetical protein
MSPELIGSGGAPFASRRYVDLVRVGTSLCCA